MDMRIWYCINNVEDIFDANFNSLTLAYVISSLTFLMFSLVSLV